MPRYRAEVEYTDEFGREQRRTVIINSPSGSAEDLARAAMDQVPGFRQDSEDRLPHNIDWELIGDDEE